MIAKHVGCKPHEFQDARYGHQMRVCNPKKEFATNNKATCTVCGAEFSIGGAPAPKEKKQ